jgi:ELWxxDGT repeat protein
MVLLHSFDRLVGPPSYMTVLGGRLLFQGGSANGREPWISDGTPQGTGLLVDVEAGPASSSPEFAVMGSAAYFLVRESLWKTDGTVAGTVVVATTWGPGHWRRAGPGWCSRGSIRLPVGNALGQRRDQRERPWSESAMISTSSLRR